MVHTGANRGAHIAGKNWYLVYTKPRNESVAEEHLNRQGFTTYLPRLHVTRKHRGKLVGRIEAMFPRYLFISLDTETDNWAPIRSTIGVSSLVRFGNLPTVVPDELIEVLMEREDASGVLTLEAPDFKTGESVRIFEGPFKDYEAVFLAKNSNERVVVLLEILGKESRISINPGYLSKSQK